MTGWFMTFPLRRENAQARHTPRVFGRIVSRSPTIEVGERHNPAPAAPARDRRSARRNLSDVPPALSPVRGPFGDPLDTFGRAVGILFLHPPQRPFAADQPGPDADLRLQPPRPDPGCGGGRPVGHARAP